KGTQLGALAVAVGYALVYYILSMRLGKEFALSGVLPPAASAWVTTVLGSGFGLWLMRRAMRR
ncbi:MAG: LptF/LptG family permease, partial [Planctomycetota bacterium]